MPTHSLVPLENMSGDFDHKAALPSKKPVKKRKTRSQKQVLLKKHVDVRRRQRDRYTNRHYETAEIINHPLESPQLFPVRGLLSRIIVCGFCGSTCSWLRCVDEKRLMIIPMSANHRNLNDIPFLFSFIPLVAIDKFART